MSLSLTQHFFLSVGAEQLHVAIDCPHQTNPRILSMHGAGVATKRRTDYLARHLFDAGHGIVRFDFSGHGDSSGRMVNSSLAKRLKEADAVACHLSSSSAPILIGTSMGGHVAARLSERLRPSLLILFCPAAFAAEAEDQEFNSSFTEIIRRPQSFRNSLAFEALRAFSGRLTIFIGSDDAVIPSEVVDLYMAAASSAKSVRLEVLSNAPHLLHGWIAARPEAERQVQRVIDEEIASL